MLCAVALCGVSMALVAKSPTLGLGAPPTVSLGTSPTISLPTVSLGKSPCFPLGDFVVQRAIQQQLYFTAELQNEPVGTWLAQFEGHEHLESSGRKGGGPGFPGTYSAALGQLCTTPYTAYLSALGDAPDDVVKVEQPRRKLSARELRNPFLVKAAEEQAAEFWDVPIKPEAILSRILTTADVMADTWAFHLSELEVGDAARVALDQATTQAMPSAEMLEEGAQARELMEGGETAISWYTEDEPLPLHAFDHRACDRLATLRALESLIEEVTALTPETTFQCGYLRCEAVADDDGDHVDARIVERRRARREKRQVAYVVGDDKAPAARQAALSFLQEYTATWVPLLTKGDERSALQKHETRPNPGMMERPRPLGAGADADAALEVLWAYMDDGSPYHIHGGELVAPARIGTRLRELRAAHAADARRELEDEVRPELLRARIAYTGYTEEDERLRLENKKAQAEADSYFKLDLRSLNSEN